MSSTTVKDVFSKGFESVREDDMLSSCFSHFRESMPPVLSVVNGEGKYKGVIARRILVRSNLDPTITKVGTLMRSAPIVSLDASLSKVAGLMIENGIRQLPVFSEDDLLGFVTDEDIIHGAVLKKWGDSKVEEIMTRKLILIEEDDSVGSVISLFRDKDISHAPIVSDGKLVGIISIHDIIERVYKSRQRQTRGERVGEKIPILGTTVKHVMSKPVITVLPSTKLRAAASKMHRFDIASVVVVRGGRPIGIVTKLDFLEPIAQMEKVDRRLTVQFSVKDDVKIDEFQRNLLMSDFESFARRYEETLEAGTLFVYMKTHGSNYGRRLIHCRLQLRTRKGSFFSSSEGWDVTETFRIALDQLDGQIIRSKELEYETESARTYLQQIGSLLTEL